MPSLVYRAFAAASVPLVPLFLRDARQRAAHRARLAAPAQLATWARAHRDPTRPLAWFHAPSVGEGLQARAVMDVLRAQLPDMQFIYTHFSPSAEDFAARLAADWCGYLCYDRVGDVERMLTAASPDLLVFTKLDLWPEIATRAAQRGARVAMVAATVTAESGRLRWPARGAAAPGYAALDLALAVAPEDVRRLADLGCKPDRIVLTGDPRIDSVLQVVEASAGPLLVRADPDQTLVAGSTWPQDEAIVLAAFSEVRRTHPGARLIVAPHQPTAEHLHGVDAAARQLGLPDPVRLGGLVDGPLPPILAVDRTGLLAQLYRDGMFAYVGGGFGHAGIHSVFEPAAWSRPVVIGPRDRDSRDAHLLEQAGALTRLTSATPATQLAETWRSYLGAPDSARHAGAAARAALETERGAARRSAELLKELVTR
jgi:3-deoxy-D-manno-octulosonic-acid transferase